ncbi:MAG: hypothetical protein R2825_20315 [Saprospiraceae bacterium]
MNDFSNYFKPNTNGPAIGTEMLKRPILHLGDVSEDASKALAMLDIKTVFDLATSTIFNNAKSMVTLGGQYALYLDHGLVPPGVLDTLQEKDWAENIPDFKLERMVSIGNRQAKSIKDNLGINTIRGLALWSPFVVAQKMLDDVFPSENHNYDKNGQEYDPEMPPDLLPTIGDYPTEKVFYRRYFLDEVATVMQKRDVTSPDLSGDGQLDIMKDYTGTDTIGFTRPMVGVEVYASQSWYAKGVALGQLLHSMALAPGESTRIAVIDWSRRTAARTSESMTEAEQLAAANTQNRALSEVTQAVAAESQHGESAVANTSFGYQEGSSESGSALGFYNASGTQGKSLNSSIASNVSRTSGSRDVAARTQQAINDNTHQQSMAARTRRATVVQETYEKESETVTTRVVTNYNHMHAMSVQYYEVVQIYEVMTEIERMERVLYVPMKPLNFSDSRVISRFKRPLYFAVPNQRFREIIAAWDGDYNIKFNGNTSAKSYFKQYSVDRDNNTPINRQIAFGILEQFKKIDKPDLIQRALEIPNRVKIEEDPIPFPEDAQLTGVDIAYAGIPIPIKDSELILKPRKNKDGTTSNDRILRDDELNKNNIKGPKIYLGNYESVSIKIPVDLGSVSGAIAVFRFIYKEQQFNICWLCRPEKGVPMELIKISSNPEEGSLISHLNENKLFYSQAIWRSMDVQMLTQMMANYQINGTSIGTYIDPQPVAITGNLIGFRWHFSPDVKDADGKVVQSERLEFEEKYQMKLGDNKPITIPLPSGGVFAEAVLGRYNCAEKLDLTRFWNWQDSPIPIVAPEIAPVQTGQHTGMEAPTTGNFSQPLAQLQQLNRLPDPTGMSEILKALSAPNLFKDLSGLTATVDLAKTGTTTAGAGAQAAGEQANEAMKIGAEHQKAMVQAYLAHQEKMAETVLPLAMGAATGGAGLAAGSISKAGAAVNMASKMDKDGSGQSSGSSSNLLSTFTSLFGGLVGKLKK